MKGGTLQRTAMSELQGRQRKQSLARQVGRVLAKGALLWILRLAWAFPRS